MGLEFNGVIAVVVLLFLFFFYYFIRNSQKLHRATNSRLTPQDILFTIRTQDEGRIGMTEHQTDINQPPVNQFITVNYSYDNPYYSPDEKPPSYDEAMKTCHEVKITAPSYEEATSQK